MPQVKEVLAARDAKRSGLKAALQRCLHGLLVQAAILSRGELESALSLALSTAKILENLSRLLCKIICRLSYTQSLTDNPMVTSESVDTL